MEHDGGHVVRVVGGRYRLVEGPLRGGMGEVWRGVDETLGRTVALKRAQEPTDPASPDPLRQLRREAEILARLEHPHVVTLYAVEPDTEADAAEPSRAPVHWLVMEWVSGGNLAERLAEAEDGRLPWPEAAELGVQLARGLAAVHGKRVTHGDIKPENVMIGDAGIAKIADFGTAIQRDGQAITRRPSCHTPEYAAPEVVGGARALPASDVFSLGATLHKLATGRTPYGDADEAPTDWRARRGFVRVGSREELGPLAGPVAAMLRHDPAARPSAAQAQRTLERLLRRPGLRPPRWRTVAATLGIAALIPLGPPVWDWLRSDPPAPDPALDQRDWRALFGDQRTADPCSLIDIEPFESYGETDLDRAYGALERCDLLIQPPGDASVDLSVMFEEEPPEQGVATAREIGGVGVMEVEAGRDFCVRQLAGPGAAEGPMVEIVAEYEHEDGVAPLCELADVAVDTAAGALNAALDADGELPRRLLPENSLARLDACTLVDERRLSAAVPGVDALDPRTGWGRWDCEWRSTTQDLRLRLRFDQNRPLTGGDGAPTRLGDRLAFVTPEGEGAGTCLVRVEHRSFTGNGGHPKLELLHLAVAGGEPVDQLCERATTAAAAAASLSGGRGPAAHE
ncbi:serine/threonine-protein kinase [Streptomyces sp. NPDC127098]|uniref:serine/threonine-protein kinase n=1 Tax=Streptomyces sp. NPDC127098 TaxID=3347137 RepID=UPI00366042D4